MNLKVSALLFNAFTWGRIALLCILCTIFTAISPVNALANAYEVRNVKVDVVAQSSLEARDKAFRQAQRDAFQTMASRFLEGDELKNFKAPEFEKIARMVRDVELVSEQSSSRRYVGVFNIRFKSSSLKNHFGKSPLEKFTTEDKSVKSGALVLPFFQQNGKTHIWDTKQNPFLKTLRAQIGKDFVVPQGDMLDVMDIRTDYISSYNNGLTKRIRGRYGSPEVIVLLARYDSTKNPPMEVDFYRTDKKKLQLTKTLMFKVTSEKTLGQFFETISNVVIAELNGNWRNDAPKPPEFQQILNTEAKQADDRKPYNPAQSEPVRGETYKPQSGTAKAVIQFQSLQEWMSIRRDISSTPAISGLRVLNLRTFETDVDISFIDEQSMVNNLTARGYVVRQTGASSYLIMRAR
jgi:hypothetical protein